MTLQIGSHLSKFESSNEVFQDSLLFALKDEDLASSSKKIMASINNGHLTHTLCTYDIFKNFHGKGVTTFSSYQGGKYFQVIQQEAFNWKIDKRDSIILGFRCQRARTSYAGRTYIAWFTPEIPVSDGPYKFSGLPGLIVKIGDIKKEHCFTMVKLRKIKYIQPIIYYKANYIAISPEEYVKALSRNIAVLFGKVQSGAITINNEEGKAKSLHSLKSINNFIEKY
jgi:Protein of unknown function (Porph_ging).